MAFVSSNAVLVKKKGRKIFAILRPFPVGKCYSVSFCSTDRFRAEEEKHKQLTARRNRMEAESVSIGGMLTELEELEAPPIEFDEKLWHAVIDRVTVYNDDRMVYLLKDGTEITVML